MVELRGVQQEGASDAHLQWNGLRRLMITYFMSSCERMSQMREGEIVKSTLKLREARSNPKSINHDSRGRQYSSYDHAHCTLTIWMISIHLIWGIDYVLRF